MRDSKPREIPGGYERVSGDREPGLLVSRVQSTVIRAGNELERMIIERVQGIADLDEFLQLDTTPDGVFLAPKSSIRKSSILDSRGAEPDFLVFRRRRGKSNCHVIELKDGHVFDTKKPSGEHRSMHDFTARNGQYLPFVIHTHSCCFNQDNREEIMRGFKGKIPIDEVLTGRDFCALLEIDYDEIVEQRRKDAEGNIRYFSGELWRIPGARWRGWNWV